MTIDASHLLVFQVNDVKWLYDRFGTAAVRTGLADAITAMDAHAGGLLGRHQAVPVPPSAMPTRWWRGFTMTGAGSALVDVCEQAEALAAAASATGHKVLLDVFGPATGGRLSFEGAVIPLPAPLPADIDAWLEQNWQKDSSRRAELAPDAAAQLRAVIAGQKLRTLLQPIVSLPSGQVVGYEALSRGPEGSALETANSLFGAGERFNLTVELELACARQAAALATALPAGRWLSINLGLTAFSTPGSVEALARPGIVIEITEHLPLDQAQAYAPCFAKARAAGGQAGAGRYRLRLRRYGGGPGDPPRHRQAVHHHDPQCQPLLRASGRDHPHGRRTPQRGRGGVGGRGGNPGTGHRPGGGRRQPGARLAFWPAGSPHGDHRRIGAKAEARGRCDCSLSAYTIRHSRADCLKIGPSLPGEKPRSLEGRGRLPLSGAWTEKLGCSSRTATDI